MLIKDTNNAGPTGTVTSVKRYDNKGVMIPVSDTESISTAASDNVLLDHETDLTNQNTAAYTHLTVADHTDLTDNGDSPLHYHATDRARANHTGTQTASTISDFDTEVGNHADVSANMTHRSSNGTDHGYIDQDLQTSSSPTFAGLTKVGGASDYLEVESDGTLELHGDATVWDDLQVSISNIKLPTSSAPSWETYDFGIASGIAFPVLAFAVSEYVFFDVQTSHSMKLNTVLDNHIHFNLPNTTDIGDKFKFQLDVIAAGLNGQWAVPSGSPYSGEHTVAANDDTYHRLLDVAEIAASNTTVSSLYKCKLTRVAASADEYGSDVYINFNDCHYEKDGIGSRQEASK